MVDGLKENNTLVTSQSGRIQPGRQAAERSRPSANCLDQQALSEQSNPQRSELQGQRPNENDVGRRPR